MGSRGRKGGQKAWARTTAEAIANQGFAVVRVQTKRWWVTYSAHPEWFRPLLRAHESEQQVVGSAMVLRGVIPASEKYMESL